ncbi:MAG: FecR family protein [Dyella sp.]|uniref:FecR family protein n=1 Tax=Dyella sp. TaxID=1869338 RepID=UPI003F7D9453
MNRHAASPRASDFPTSAEAWLARLHSPLRSPQDEEAFERWRAADPDHAAAFAEVEYLHRNAAQLADDPLLRAVARAARRDLARRPPARVQRTWWLAAGLAAAVLAAVGLTHLMRQDAPVERSYATGTGLPQALTLADGTEVRLDAQSSLVTRFGAHQREVIVRNGRAQFRVAHDTARPFVVLVDGNVIRDIGTTFQVSRRAEGVTVGLLEGRVSVSRDTVGQAWTSELAPAQQLHIDTRGHAAAVAPLDLDQARSWTHGELSFDQRRLDDLLQSMNRYSTTQLRLGDPALASLRVSGSFHAGDQDALAKALAQGWKLRVERTTANELTLLPAAGAR